MGGGPPGEGGFGARRPTTGNFGPDAPPKGKKSKFKPAAERGPKGPIRVKPDGRIYSTDDLDEGEDAFEGDNFATRADEPEDDAGGE
jgi:hypothetical protein